MAGPGLGRQELRKTMMLTGRALRARVRELEAEAGRLARALESRDRDDEVTRRRQQAASRATVVVTSVTWNPETDMAEVRHDGALAWQDSLGHIDQYLRHVMPRGVPVILELDED
jgi:hypothetical protein